MDDHEKYMKRAIELGWRGIGRNSPNPLVGCVIVRDGEIVGEGSHFYPEVEHAEVIALREAGDKAKGATLYATFEPCCHTGRTPPCFEAIKNAGIKEVIYGIQDPDPRVNGAGHCSIEESGIEITGGILEDEIREQNKFFITAKEKNRPYILLKWAMTLDGKIATRTGKSRWISNEKSLNTVHHLRNIYDAILAGHTTVITDNPKLTCRVNASIYLPEKIFPATPSDIRNPVRVIVDTFGASIAHDCDIYSQPGKTIVAVGPESVWDDHRHRDSVDNGKIELVECPVITGHVDIEFLLKSLVERGIQSVLVEGGSGIHAAFLEKGLVDEIMCFVTPKVFGGNTAPSPVAGVGFDEVVKAVQLEDVKHISIGNDVLVFGKVMNKE